MKRCSVPFKCGRAAGVLGLCFEHVWTDGGFRAEDNGCWTWLGARNEDGYGRFGRHYAHRISYERYVGVIPPGLQPDHLCRNTACVNPAHLELVTQKVNMLRSNNPGALAVRTNRCKHDHEFTDENTYWRPDGTGRACRECTRIRQRHYTAQPA